MHVQEMYRRLTGLVVFRRLLQDPVVAACGEMLSARVRGDSGDFSAACAGFEAALFQSSDSWSCYLREAVLESENVCIRGQAVGRSSVLQESLRRELAFFDQLSQLQLEDLTAGLREPPEFLVGWVVSPTDITREYLRRMEEVGVKGYGIFARYHVFTVEEGQLAPVKHPDPQRLEELPGYEREREKVIANTRALLEGRRVNDVLLYGDSGTGKSATVKCLLSVPDFGNLRLIEVQKEGLRDMPALIRSLRGRQQKFILFIDDLAFDQDDNTYSVVKTILEGGLEKRPDNVAIYATSNRRLLVRQTFSDRAGDEVDIRETIAEKTALSDRFGLRIPYLALNKAEFLELIEQLADQAGVSMDRGELMREAVKWDMKFPGRTPRGARQFIASLSAR